jgi:hypothetical protein
MVSASTPPIVGSGLVTPTTNPSDGSNAVHAAPAAGSAKRSAPPGRLPRAPLPSR